MFAKVRRLTNPSDPAMATVEQIYVDALPANERKPVAWLRSLPCGHASSALLVAERDRAVLGFAVLFVPTTGIDAALLEYLAVAEAARGGGVGGQLFAHAVALAGRAVLIEIETGDADADRRRAFYRRLGCRELLGLRYLLPLPGAPPMGLMVAGADVVTQADLARWLAIIYAEVYGQPPDDPRIAVMTADAVLLAGT